MEDMKDKKSGIAAMIVSKMKPSAPEGEMSEGQEEESDYDMAAKDVMSAVESKDASMLGKALKSFYQMCSMEPSEDEAE